VIKGKSVAIAFKENDSRAVQEDGRRDLLKKKKTFKPLWTEEGPGAYVPGGMIVYKGKARTAG